MNLRLLLGGEVLSTFCKDSELVIVVAFVEERFLANGLIGEGDKGYAIEETNDKARFNLKVRYQIEPCF